MSNVIMQQIHQVIGDLVQTCNITQTYVEKYYPWSRISAAAAFLTRSTENMLKSYSLGQLVFGRDMTFLIKHTVDWELIR